MQYVQKPVCDHQFPFFRLLGDQEQSSRVLCQTVKIKNSFFNFSIILFYRTNLIVKVQKPFLDGINRQFAAIYTNPAPSQLFSHRQCSAGTCEGIQDDVIFV